MDDKKMGRKKRWLLDLAEPSPALTAAMRDRIGRWKSKRESWQVWEACDLAFHVFPFSGIRNLWYFRAIESEMLTEDLERYRLKSFGRVSARNEI